MEVPTMVRVSTLGFGLIIAALLLPLHPLALHLGLLLSFVIPGIALMEIGGQLEALRGEVDDLYSEIEERRKLKEAKG